jgi:hypothetical protein
MAHAMHAHDTDDMLNFVNHAIIADANAPVVFRSGKFPATGRTGIMASFKIAARIRS